MKDVISQESDDSIYVGNSVLSLKNKTRQIIYDLFFSFQIFISLYPDKMKQENNYINFKLLSETQPKDLKVCQFIKYLKL